MSNWTPNQTILDQIVQLLKESHSPDTEIQRNVEQVRTGDIETSTGPLTHEVGGTVY